MMSLMLKSILRMPLSGLESARERPRRWQGHPPQPSLQEIWIGMEKEDAGCDSDDEYYSLCEDAEESQLARPMPLLGGVDSSTSSNEPLEGAASQVAQC